MKIAVAIDNHEHLHERFGRADAWLVVDTESGQRERLDNPHKDNDHGAGTGASALLIRAGVGAVVGPHFGPKAEQVLAKAKVATWLAPAGMPIDEVLDAFAAGTLKLSGTKAPK